MTVRPLARAAPPTWRWHARPGAANGRIVDVDIAQETTNLARQQVLVQASAAMTAQANLANDVALMLLQ